MFDLFLAIIFSAMIPVLMKYAHRKNCVDEVILTFNYFIAVVFSLLFTIFNYDNYRDLSSHLNTIILLAVVGMTAGLMYYFAFYFYQKSVRENGVSLSMAVGKMGIIIPMFLSLILWQEIPTGFQWLGILMSMIAIALINIKTKDFMKFHFKTSLLMFFVSGGLGDFFNKYFESNIGLRYTDLFLVIVFAIALMVSLYPTIKYKNITRLSVLYGFAVGIPNMLTSFFLISALAVMNATVVFPLYSGGAIMLSMFWSLFAFSERLKRKDIFAITLILIALFLINV